MSHIGKVEDRLFETASLDDLEGASKEKLISDDFGKFITPPPCSALQYYHQVKEQATCTLRSSQPEPDIKYSDLDGKRSITYEVSVVSVGICVDVKKAQAPELSSEDSSMCGSAKVKSGS